ncbi:hypothetical protein BASA81_010272 [Batrachochytrium salamandrivorans]|nr:hypothetical protein BASA81_010272 [Batrachochytrium salamandrivorans]
MGEEGEELGTLTYVIRDGWLQAFESTIPYEKDAGEELWKSTFKAAGRRDTLSQVRGSFGVFELGSKLKVADCSTRFANLSSKVRLAKWVRGLVEPPIPVCPQSGWLRWDYDMSTPELGSEFLLDMKQNGTTYVMKKDGASGGSGIYFVNSIAQVERIVLEGIDLEEALPFLDERRDAIADWAVQRHIDSPMLLLGGHKFHLRAFVVHVDNRVFFYDTYEVRIAPLKWTMDFEDRNCHITNGGGSEAHHERRFLAKDFELELGNICRTKVPEFLHYVLANAQSPESSEDLQPGWLPASVMGLDIMVDTTGRLHLLEANHSMAAPPVDEMTEFGCHVRQLCRRIVRQIVAAPLGHIVPGFQEVFYQT